jgi:hypothetical protein
MNQVYITVTTWGFDSSFRIEVNKINSKLVILSLWDKVTLIPLLKNTTLPIVINAFYDEELILKVNNTNTRNEFLFNHKKR